MKPWAPSALAAARPMPLEQPVISTKGWGMKIILIGGQHRAEVGMVARVPPKQNRATWPGFRSEQMPDYMMVNGMMMWNLTSCSELNMFG